MLTREEEDKEKTKKKRAVNSLFSDTDIFVPPSVLLASSDPTEIRDPNAQVTGAIYASRRATSDAGKGRRGGRGVGLHEPGVCVEGAAPR